MDDEIETFRYEADKESDKKEKERKEAIWEASVNNKESLRQSNINDNRLAGQYETQIRAI
jgi:hypothetical protein